MLKKTLLMMGATAGLTAAVMVPATSATAAASKKGSTCPPGQANGSNYCEGQCVVPQVVGRGLVAAELEILIADCKIGHIYLDASDATTARPLIVLSESPAAGSIEPARTPVDLWLQY